jgi:elongation factor Ts
MAVISAAMIKELRERTSLGIVECRKALIESDGDIELAIDNLRKEGDVKASKKATRIAGDGVTAARVAKDNSYGVVVEVNSETDFVARDEGFLNFVASVVDRAFVDKQTDVTVLRKGLETELQELVQKVGENISIRRVELLEGGTVGAYVHSNNRIAVLSQLSAGDAELAKDVAMHVAAVNSRVVNPDDMPEDVLDKEKAIIKAQPDMKGKPDSIVEKMMFGRIKKFLQENSLTEQSFVKNPDITVGQLAAKVGAKVLNFVRFEVGEGIEVKKADFAAEVAAQVKASSQ